MKKIAVFTGTRADYGLLYWLLKDIQASRVLDLQLLVSGMHLSPEFGLTKNAILADGFKIDAQVEMLLSSDSPVGVVKSIGVGLIGFADALDRLAPDCLIVLGDRFEALAAAEAALVLRVPIAHLHGGEKTEGAYDDAIRHAITKMANLHFVAADEYRNRVIQMGESPESVLNVGALGLDHLVRSSKMGLIELSDSLKFDLRQPFIMATYHPVTAGEESPEKTMAALLSALDVFSDYQVLITYPNADNGGRSIIALIDAYAQRHPDRVCAVPSLGSMRYLTAMSLASAVVGNSSSGIIEAPAYRVPTVDIGVRQEGRLAAASVIHAIADRADIIAAIRRVLSKEHAQVTAQCVNPYGSGDAAREIVRYLEENNISSRKKFHDRA